MKKLRFTIVLLLAVTALSAQQTAFTTEVVGKGQPVLLFPGFTCTGEVWKETVDLLSVNHECHIFTFAGFGGVPPIGSPWLAVIKTQVIEYVNRLKLKNPVIIGHSIGGTLGLWLAASETTMFKKLVIVDALPAIGALLIPNFNADSIQYNNPYSKQLLVMEKDKFTAMAKQSAAFMSLNKTKHEQLINWAIAADRPTYVNGYTDLLKLDLRKSIAGITIPVVILAATYPDKKIIEQTYNAQYQQLPAKTFFYADNSAHFIMFDQPAWFLEKIKENVN